MVTEKTKPLVDKCNLSDGELVLGKIVPTSSLWPQEAKLEYVCV